MTIVIIVHFSTVSRWALDQEAFLLCQNLGLRKPSHKQAEVICFLSAPRLQENPPLSPHMHPSLILCTPLHLGQESRVP